MFFPICFQFVDDEDKTSLLSLVKTFDSVLAAYEGFCNLKQVFLVLFYGYREKLLIFLSFFN